MKSQFKIMTFGKISLIASAIAIYCLLGLALHAAPASKADAAAASTSTQKQFDTPKEAADALIQAAETYDVAGAKEILGAGSEDLISSEDPEMDRNRAHAFAAKARGKNSRYLDKNNPDQTILLD